MESAIDLICSKILVVNSTFSCSVRRFKNIYVSFVTYCNFT